MPIVDIQRRFRELGRIRMGVKELVTEGGKPKLDKKGNQVSRPKKISTWRLTTPWKHLLEAAVELGVQGEIKPWSPEPGRDEWELITDQKKLDVVVPPGETLTQWYELWKGGGCDRRCDGVRMLIDQGKSADKACRCGDPRDCKPTSRLIVMLPGLPDLGVWRLESHGFYAASELGGAVVVTELATQRGVMIPAELRIEPRSIKRPGQTVKRFGVPVLGFRHQLGAVLEALGFGDPSSDLALGAGGGPVGARPALTEGGTPAPSLGAPAAALEAPARKGVMDPPGPVEPSTLPKARGGNAVEAKPTVIDTDGTEIDIDADAEPEAFVPPPPEPEPESGGAKTYTAAQIVAIRAREHGISEDERHAVIGIVTRGRTRTAKELTRGAGREDEVGRVLKTLDGLHEQRMTLVRAGDAWEITDSKGVTLRLNADNSIERRDP